MNPLVDNFLNNATKWQKELEQLRSIILKCNLNEDFKWKHPCYTYNNKNIVLIHGFKEYCAILFMQGVLLKDEKKILIQQTENVQGGRQIRFTNIKEIIKLEKTLFEYILEAIEIEKSGLIVKYKDKEEYEIIPEFKDKLNKTPDLNKAFNKLTAGRQKGYLLYFASAKQSKTKLSRIEECENRILKGLGLNDCTCGLSKRFPNCDGSHKILKSK